ncbi:DUF3309 family protein [Hydrogenophaga sp.]|uniref:DUF3309 family protein n=1 Tax=Hydrogenophaga sp. TaxID=1904254 RepID=UPI00341C2E17
MHWRRQTAAHNCILEENATSLGTLLLIVGAVPTWGHGKSWSHGTISGRGLVADIQVALLLTGHL